MATRRRAPLPSNGPTVGPSDAMLRIAAAHQRDAIVITAATTKRAKRAERTIVYVNPAFTVMTGFAAEESVGKTPSAVFGPEIDPKAIQALGTAVTMPPFREELLVRRKDGTTFWCELDLASVPGTNETPPCFVSTMRDITEQRRKNDVLRFQADTMGRALAARSLFLANVSHELRTPLNAILGYASMLERGVQGELTPRQRQSITRINANSQSLLQLIGEILDLTRIESGKMSIHLSRFDIRELVDETISDLDSAIARSKLEVSKQVSRGRFVVMSDRQKVKQIILNLVSNALKFTASGWVNVELSERGGVVSMTVADSGSGIPVELQERVFDDFWRLEDAAQNTMSGAGLGLPISRRLATLLGGELTVKSSPKRGSRFTVTIPLTLDGRRTSSSRPRAPAGRTKP